MPELWHWPLLSFAHVVAGTMPSPLVRAELVALAFALAWATFALVERPIRRSLPLDGRGPAGVAVVLAGGEAMVVSALLGALVWWNGGIRDRAAEMTPQQRFVRYVETMRPWSDLGCPRDISCRTNAHGAAEFAIYGDSHAEHYIPGLLGEDTERQGWLYVGHPACPPVANVNTFESGRSIACDRKSAEARAYLVGRPDVRTAVLSSLASPYFNGAGKSAYSRDGAFRLESTLVGAGPKGLEAIWYDGLRETIAELTAAGKRVVLMLDNPELPFQPARSSQRPLRSWLAPSAATQYEFSRADYERRSAGERAFAAKLKAEFPDLRVYDPVGVFCDDRNCHVRRNGIALYRDSDHLSPEGSRYAAAAFLKWLASAR